MISHRLDILSVNECGAFNGPIGAIQSQRISPHRRLGTIGDSVENFQIRNLLTNVDTIKSFIQFGNEKVLIVI